MILARRGDRHADAFLVWLLKREVNLTIVEIVTLRIYLERLVMDRRRGNAARPRFYHAAPPEIIDDHLLAAGLSESCFKENVVALGCNSGMQFHGQLHERGAGMKLDC